jgi:mRNA-degrading endonuclease RelE of RelBE toxin-antitoxin system
MRETLEILSDPAMLARIQAGRRAVAVADTRPLAEVLRTPATGTWTVVVTTPVARELAERQMLPEDALEPLLAALGTAPAEQGHPLGMGLVGVWSARAAAHRVLYAVHREQRLVTVLSVDDT